VSPRDVGDLERFVRAWDGETIGPHDLLPAPGRIGSDAVTRLVRADVAAVIAALVLRPPLDAYFARVRDALSDGDWTLGVCPFCGAPPGFADIVEDGRRRLACQMCGGAWPFSRTQCPFCGSHDTEQQVRLELGAADEGYFIAGCRACSSYLKELDRRTRWNGGPALVEDWGSPHYDVAARRQRYTRPAIALLELADLG